MSKQIPNMKFLSPTGATKICFLIGNKISDSPSPALHTGWFRRLGSNIIYLPCQIKDEENFENVMASLLKIENFYGANITMPFKSRILNMLDIIHSDSVKAIGAANTLYKNSSNTWCLENTDVYGMKKTIQKLIPKNTDYNLIVLGGGGAASACIYYGDNLDTYCKKIFCFTRNPSKTWQHYPQLKNYKKLRIISSEQRHVLELIRQETNNKEYSLIVNSVPVDKTEDTIKNNLLIQLVKIIDINKMCYFDMVYKKTSNIEFAKNLKIKCKDGLLMLREQAKKSFFLWTGILP